MRVIIILAAIALTHGAKLERTYLPPSNAGTAGGSGNFLQTPVSGVSGPGVSISSARNQNAQSGFPQSSNGFSQSSNGIGQSQNAYSQSGNDYSQSSNGFSQSGNGFAQSGAQYDNVNFNNFATEARPERPRAALERNAAILRQDSSNDGETFSYAFETENGIYAEESGVATNGVEAQGGYSYTGDDGQVYSVRYTADQNGFVPQGDHLPTPPPVPEEILKALEQNARDEAAGIYDDGSYNEGKYAPADNNNRQFNYQQNNAFTGNDDDTVVTNSALARSGNAPSYNAPRNGPSYNTPNGIAATYGAPNAGKAPSFNSGNSGLAPTYGAPITGNAPFNSANAGIAPTYGAPRSGNAISNSASYGALSASNAPSFNTPAGTPFNSVNAGTTGFNAPNAAISRSSGVEKAYLPPLAEQREQERNAFGRRQQSFDERTGYKY